MAAANIAAAQAPAATASGRAYNIAGGQERSLLDLLEIVRGLLGVDTTAVHVGPRAGDVRHSSADLSAARADLGYDPKVSFEDGLALTIDHFA